MQRPLSCPMRVRGGRARALSMHKDTGLYTMLQTNTGWAGLVIPAGFPSLFDGCWSHLGNRGSYSHLTYIRYVPKAPCSGRGWAALMGTKHGRHLTVLSRSLDNAVRMGDRSNGQQSEFACRKAGGCRACAQARHPPFRSQISA